MKVLLTLDGTTESGGAPLVLHNERLADPLDDFTRQIAKVSKKRNKTDADHRDIARLEFLGGLYLDENNEPALPAFNILRCLQDGAKRTKRGADVLRGVTPLVQYVAIAYAGPRHPETMYQHGGFMLRKAVGVQKSRTMRTRPMFQNWSAVLPVEVDPTVFDPDTLAAIWRDAGIYAGLGEMRPIYGKFRGLSTEWTIATDCKIGETSYALACAIQAKRIQTEDLNREARQGSIVTFLQNVENAIGSMKEELAAVGSNGHL